MRKLLFVGIFMISCFVASCSSNKAKNGSEQATAEAKVDVEAKLKEYVVDKTKGFEEMLGKDFDIKYELKDFSVDTLTCAMVRDSVERVNKLKGANVFYDTFFLDFTKIKLPADTTASAGYIVTHSYSIFNPLMEKRVNITNRVLFDKDWNHCGDVSESVY